MLVIIIYNLHIEIIDFFFDRMSVAWLMADPRILIWGTAFRNFRIVGWGYGGWSVFAQQLPFGLRSMPLHNHILILGYIGGIVSIILYILFLGSLFLEGKKSLEYNTGYSSIMICFVINVLVHGMFDNYFLGHMNILVMAFLLLGYIFEKIHNSEVKCNAKSVLFNYSTSGKI